MITLTFLYFILAGMLGVFTHYGKKWLRGEIAGSLINYLFSDHPRQTALACLAFLGAAATLALSEQLVGLSQNAVLMLGFTTGYSIDSAVNKSAPSA